MLYTLRPLEVRTVTLDASGQSIVGASPVLYASSNTAVFTVAPVANNYQCKITAIAGGENMGAKLTASFGGKQIASADVIVLALSADFA
jgi:hypothetical protein